jgi:hypothetical protein
MCTEHAGSPFVYYFQPMSRVAAKLDHALMSADVLSLRPFFAPEPCSYALSVSVMVLVGS